MRSSSLLKSFSLSLFIFASYAYAETEIAGDYHCKGYDPYAKKDYETPLAIQKKENNTFSFEWKTDPKTTFYGTGIMNKDNNNVAAIFWDPKDKKFTGVIIFQIGDNKLEGNWVVKNEKVTGYETCEKK